MRAFVAFVAAVMLTACATKVMTRTVVETRIQYRQIFHPSVLALDTADTNNRSVLGGTNCDLSGEPYIVLRPSLDSTRRFWVLIHEHVHVRQMREHTGGCAGFVQEFITNETF